MPKRQKLSVSVVEKKLTRLHATKYHPAMSDTVIIEDLPLTPEMALLFEKAKRNVKWFSDHAMELEVFKRYRGKYVAASGGELFVADTADEVRRLAKEKYPDDLAHVRYIPKEKLSRIYACKR